MVCLAAFLSLLLSIMLGRLLCKSNLPVALIDMPDDRKIHTTPTPLIGGLTILFSSLLTMLLFNLRQNIRS